MAGRRLALLMLAAPVLGAAQPAPRVAVDAPSRMSVAMNADLAERRRNLERRARELELRERLIEASEKRIDAKIALLRRLQTGRQPADPRTQALVKLYQAMRPRDAARIVERLDLDLQVAVASTMRERPMAAIMAQMQPDAAKALSMALGGRMEAKRSGS